MVAAGTSVYAALPGKVIETGFNLTDGNYIIIQHRAGNKTLYGHLNAINTKRGAYVSQDSIIGTVGNTGISNEPHLHFEVSKDGTPVNPAGLCN